MCALFASNVEVGRILKIEDLILYYIRIGTKNTSVGELG